MLQNVLENITVTIIVTALLTFARWLFHSVKRFMQTPVVKQKYAPRMVVHKQFYFALLSLVISLVIGLSVPAQSPFSIGSLIKIPCLITAFFSLIFVMGAFDAAFDFYPDDETRDNKPPKDNTNHNVD